MSEEQRVAEIRRNNRQANEAADELMYHPETRSIGPSIRFDPDDAILITKPDADVFGSWRR